MLISFAIHSLTPDESGNWSIWLQSIPGLIMLIVLSIILVPLVWIFVKCCSGLFSSQSTPHLDELIELQRDQINHNPVLIGIIENGVTRISSNDRRISTGRLEFARYLVNSRQAYQRNDDPPSYEEICNRPQEINLNQQKEIKRSTSLPSLTRLPSENCTESFQSTSKY